MKVAKWGNSLAIRIPTDVVEKLGLKEGDDVDLKPSEVNGLELIRLASRRERVERLREILKDRLPADYQFDRQEANARR
ncbi:MAG: AbrB/MazE/SpoVT family DNA-binding domain-containing protein [Burkholderiales bacterium]|nr:MAG: AbrB/MazE/SpoVT family DNA-binding domain-containing protein [Burkholderiales bacterium]